MEKKGSILEINKEIRLLAYISVISRSTTCSKPKTLCVYRFKNLEYVTEAKRPNLVWILPAHANTTVFNSVEKI